MEIWRLKSEKTGASLTSLAVNCDPQTDTSSSCLAGWFYSPPLTRRTYKYRYLFCTAVISKRRTLNISKLHGYYYYTVQLMISEYWLNACLHVAALSLLLFFTGVNWPPTWSFRIKKHLHNKIPWFTRSRCKSHLLCKWTFLYSYCSQCGKLSPASPRRDT